MADAKRPQDRSLVELFRDLANEIKTLVHQEIRLAKTEATQKATKIAKSLVLVVVGAVLGLGAFLAMIAFFILAIGVFVKLWLAALIVTVVLGALAAALALAGLKKMKNVGTPTQTIQTLKDDAQWAKNQAAKPHPPAAATAAATAAEKTVEVKP